MGKEPKKKNTAKKKGVTKKASSRAPRKKKTVSARTTSLTAKIDIGFGNRMFLRGEGPGLSWDKGTAMDNKKADEWVWSTSAAKENVHCKVLVNDEVWSGGENVVIKPGENAFITPHF